MKYRGWTWIEGGTRRGAKIRTEDRSNDREGIGEPFGK